MAQSNRAGSVTYSLNRRYIAEHGALVAVRKAHSLCRQIVAEAAERAPVDTGNLAREIEQLPTRVAWPYVITGVHAYANYARYVHDGTGIFGPARQLIVPKAGYKNGVLRFTASNGDIVFAAYTRGMPGRPFLKNAAEFIMARNRVI